jgi:hypothetical protein
VLTPTLPNRLLLCGSFGFGNAGDEAVPLAIADVLHGMDAGAIEIELLTRFDRPELGGAIGLGEEYAEERQAMKGAVVAAVGGGIVEPNNFCVLSRCHRFIASDFASASGLFAVNVESAVRYSWLQRHRIRGWVRDCRVLTVRDVVSQAAFRRVLKKGTSVEVIGDSVLGLKPSAEVSSDVAGMRPFLAVTLAPRWNGIAGWLEWVSDEIARVSAELGLNVVFVPMSVVHDDDRPGHRAVAERLHGAMSGGCQVYCVEEATDPRELMAVFGMSDLTLSMRLHGCVMAYAAGRPFVALGYHPKIWGFAESVGWGDAVVPQKGPRKSLRRNGYGFSFADLGVSSGAVVRMARSMVDRDDFSMRARYLARQRDALRELMRGVPE